MRKTGHGNIQAGSVGGDVTNVTIVQTVHVTAPLTSAESMPTTSAQDHKRAVAPPVDAAMPEKPSVPVEQDVAVLRRELFALLEKFDRTPDRRIIALNWMDQQFGTKRVVELDRQQLLRTVRWSAVVLKDRQKKREERGTAVR